MKKKKLLISSLITSAVLVGSLATSIGIASALKASNNVNVIDDLANKRSIEASNNKLRTNQKSTLQDEDFTLNNEHAIDLVDGNVSITTSTSICAVSNGTIAVVNNRLRFINPNGTIKWTYSDSNIGSEKGKIISTLYMPVKNAVAVLAQDAVKGPGYAVILLINIDNGKNLFYQSVAFSTEDGNDGGLDGAIIPVYGAQYGVQSFIVMPRRFLNLGERSKYSYLVNYYPTTPIVSQMEIGDGLPSCIIGGVAILDNEPSPGSNIQPIPTLVLIKQLTNILDGNRGAYLFAHQYSSSIKNGKYTFESMNVFNYYEENNNQIIEDSRDLIFMNPRGTITSWNNNSNHYREFNIPINFTHNGVVGNTFRILSGGWTDTRSLYFNWDRCISFTNADSSANLDMDVPYIYVQDQYVYGFASYARINGVNYDNSIFRIKMLNYASSDNLALFTQESFNKYNGDNTNERFRVYKNLTPSVGIPVPSYDNPNDYIYFFENNKAQMKVINPTGGTNNAGSYAYVTRLKNKTFDFSSNPTLNTISVNDPKWKNIVEHSIQISLDNYFKQYPKYARVRLSNLRLDPKNGQVIADVILDYGYSLDGFFATDCSWFDCVFKGFKIDKPTTLQAMVSLADIDSSLINKEWKDVDQVAFKNKVISYFNDTSIKNQYAIPSDATIAVESVDTNNVANGEVKLTLNLSKYVDQNLTTQANGKLTLTVTGFAKYQSSTLQASVALADIDASLVNKAWKDIDQNAFKNSVVTYFNKSNIKNQYAIPSDATIAVESVDTNNVANGEVKLTLNLSKYVDQNLTTQANGKLTLTVTGFAQGQLGSDNGVLTANETNNLWWIILVSIGGGITLLILLVILIVASIRRRERDRYFEY